LHSLLAALWFKKKAQQWMGKTYRHYRLLYTLFAFISLVLILYYQIQIDTIILFASNTLTLITGIVVTLIGLVIMSICIGKYFVSLSGIKSLVREHSSNDLIISGIHKYVRHPLYLGTFTFIWGLLIILPVLSLLVANTIITLYTVMAIRWEEDKLIAEFGEDYRIYKSKVPALIPGLKPYRKA
jgi:methanethiol S-methyltransferase